MDLNFSLGGRGVIQADEKYWKKICTKGCNILEIRKLMLFIKLKTSEIDTLGLKLCYPIDD